MSEVNPYKLAHDTYESAYKIKRDNVLYIAGSILTGTSSVFMMPSQMGVGLTLAFAISAAGILASRGKLSSLRQSFNDAAQNVHQNARPKLQELAEELNREGLFNTSEFSFKQHPFRTAWYVACVGITTVAPALGGFFLGPTMLDQQTDHLNDISNKAHEARVALRPWRTGMTF